MYHRGKSKIELEKKAPFEIICANCGSHNVDVIAHSHWKLEIECKTCESYLTYGCYNETKWNR